jgi:hypothetical protein
MGETEQKRGKIQRKWWVRENVLKSHLQQNMGEAFSAAKRLLLQSLLKSFGRPKRLFCKNLDGVARKFYHFQKRTIFEKVCQLFHFHSYVTPVLFRYGFDQKRRLSCGVCSLATRGTVSAGGIRAKALSSIRFSVEVSKVFCWYC